MPNHRISLRAAPLRLILCGAAGRMCGRVAALAQADPRFQIAAGVVRSRGTEPSAHQPRSDRFPLIFERELADYIPHADLLIDFSSPAGSVRFAQAAAQARKPILIGTTGFTRMQYSRLRSLSRRTAVFLSPNFSPGMNLAFHLAQIAAAALPRYDLAILEIHHAQKKDAPSGTALRWAERIRQARPQARIPIASLRLGTVTGEHRLTLAGPLEEIEIVHRAESRDLFARNALEAALWLRGRKPALYTLQDQMGLPASPRSAR